MKKVLITGGVRGIGKGIALGFLQKKYAVYATYEQNEQAAAELEKLGVKTVRVNVCDERATEQLFRELGGVDILVNNAGVCHFSQIQDVTKEEFDRVFGVNTWGTVLCSREAAKYMIAKKSGLIVNVSSVWGEVGASCESVYAASKAAVIGFTKSLAKELGVSGIRVNCVSPGVIDTDMLARFSEEEKADLAAETTSSRLGTPSDIAKAVLFLEENDYVNGVNIPVNGGFSIV